MQTIEENMSKLNLDYHKITKILFSKPFLSVSEFSELMGYTRQTATKYIQLLEKNNLVSSMKIGKNKLLYISSFINLLQ